MSKSKIASFERTEPFLFGSFKDWISMWKFRWFYAVILAHKRKIAAVFVRIGGCLINLIYEFWWTATRYWNCVRAFACIGGCIPSLINLIRLHQILNQTAFDKSFLRNHRQFSKTQTNKTFEMIRRRKVEKVWPICPLSCFTFEFVWLSLKLLECFYRIFDAIIM